MDAFSKYANVEYSEAEKSEILSRLEKKMFTFGTHECTLFDFQKEKDGANFRVSTKEDCVLEYSPIFKNMENAQLNHFWKIALNWSKGLSSEKVSFSVSNTFSELQLLGIDPFLLSESLIKTQGQSIEALIGLKALIKKEWSPNKYHLAYNKEKQCHFIVDCAEQAISASEYLMPKSGADKSEFAALHAKAANEVFEMFATKSYEQQPAVKIYRLETANNSSINDKLAQFLGRKKAPFANATKKIEDDLPF